MCSSQGMWADNRVAPTIPASETPISGNNYFIYNVETGLFLDNTNSVGETALTIRVDIKNNGDYLFKIISKDYYIGTLSNAGDLAHKWAETIEAYWTIAECENGYSIQCSPLNTNCYKENQFWGVVEESTTIKSNCSSDGQTHWLFIPANDSGNQFVAEMKLYRALSALDVCAFPHSITEQFERIYADRSNQTPKILSATAIQVRNATGMSIGYQAPWWNEYPVMFYTADGSYGQSVYDTWVLPDNQNTKDPYFYRRVNEKSSSSISATIAVDEPSTLIYSLYNRSDEIDVEVYVDDILARALHNGQVGDCQPTDITNSRFSETLTPGVHTITWIYRNKSQYSHYIYLKKVGVMKTPNITVSLLEPGSLGTEVLYNTDFIKNVRSLKVIGKMNNEDWAKIKMMSRLINLDLSEAEFIEIPENQFRLASNDTTMQFMRTLSLPEGLQKINKQAFYYSFIEHVNLPSTLKSVGNNAFSYSRIQELIMPDDFTEWGGDDDHPFQNMRWLKKAVLPKNLTYIPRYSMSGNYFISDLVLPEKVTSIGNGAFYQNRDANPVLPEGLTSIGESAFYDCSNRFNPILPNSLTSIGESAFRNCYSMGDTLRIPENVSSMGANAFQDCRGLRYVEISSNINNLNDYVFYNSPNIQTIKLDSPTVMKHTSGFPVSDISRITLQVPHYLVNNYKLDDYWYNATAIEPFDYSSMANISLRDNLTLNHERFGGQPSIWMEKNTYLKVNGDKEQKFKDLSIECDYPNKQYSQILSNCDQLTGYGENIVRYHTYARNWYFISLPFDLRISDIYNNNDAQYAIRYYDGKSRASNGKSGNWKDYTSTDVIPAGTGFIFQTNIEAWSYFPALDNENKFINTIGVTEFTKTLDVNASGTPSNKGWNLVGNPYQCYYNNHCLNFTAPITIWNANYMTYTAYSITDDDYAIRPNEAFFVQCPNEEYNTIGFPLQGRQLTADIESQNAVKAWMPKAINRQVVNLSISNGNMQDQTRVVLNEEASMTYEVNCDASKFMSLNSTVPQLYTIDNNGTQYAINERPIRDGMVGLGFYAGETGDYTISVSRCDAEQVFITDYLTSETTDITGSTYTFSSKAGIYDTRLALNFVTNDATPINDVEKVDNIGKREVYSVDGKLIGTNTNNLGAGVYVIRQNKKVNKVVIH